MTGLNKFGIATKFETDAQGFRIAVVLGYFVEKHEGKITVGTLDIDGVAQGTLMKEEAPQVAQLIVKAVVDCTSPDPVTTVRLSPQLFAWGMFQGVINPSFVFQRQSAVMSTEQVVFITDELTVWVETTPELDLMETTGRGYADGFALFSNGKRIG